MSMTDSQKCDLATALHVAWKKYYELFGESPHGTLKQIGALVELATLDDLATGIGQRAICLHCLQLDAAAEPKD